MNQTTPTHPFRLILISLVVTGAIWLATVAAMSIPPATQGIDLAAGSGTFRDHCGACHIVEKGISTHHGPNLYDFGKIAGTRKADMTAAEYIWESIRDPEAFVAPENRHGMPRNLATVLSPEDIRNVIAYVISRGGSPDYEEIRNLEIPDLREDSVVRTIRREDMELAERTLRERGGCLQCHALYRNAEYTVFAPGLFGVGLSDAQLVRESIVDPNKVVAPIHLWVNVFLNDGKMVSGKLISRTDDRLVLIARGSDNQLVRHDIAMADVESEDGEPLIVPSETSPMPTGLDKLLTEEELDVLVTMIQQLN